MRLHGTFEGLECQGCSEICHWDEWNKHQKQLSCPTCADDEAPRQKRRANLSLRKATVGELRPRITFLGESYIREEDRINELISKDLAQAPDLILVMGTSLEVGGPANLVRQFAQSTHANEGHVVFVNLSALKWAKWDSVFDFWLSKDCDGWVKSLDPDSSKE